MDTKLLAALKKKCIVFIYIKFVVIKLFNIVLTLNKNNNNDTNNDNNNHNNHNNNNSHIYPTITAIKNYNRKLELKLLSN